jgi:nucleotide-binding universal stress UspA family protein
MPEIRTILCPVDFSFGSDHALEYALLLAATHGAGIVLLHVLHPLAFGVGADGLTPDIGARVLRDMEASCRRHLGRTAAQLRARGANVTEKLVTGTPFHEIIQWARAEKVDLIVMGTHGRTGLVSALIGSVAERVVRKAPCPVLTVKHPEHNVELP